jgi:DNA-binding protein HU-beta
VSRLIPSCLYRIKAKVAYKKDDSMSKNTDQQKPLTKDGLVASISELSGLSKKDSLSALEGFLQSVTNSLKEGKDVTIVGFGSFSVTERPEREGRNPSTGKPIKIKATKLPKFKAGKNFKEAIL